MFELSFGEILFVAVVALIVIGPKDLPNALKYLVKGVKEIRGLSNELRRGVNEMVHEIGLDEADKEVRTIIDQYGQKQITYDLDDFIEKNEAAVSTPPDKKHEPS